MGYDSNFNLRVYTKTEEEARQIISKIEEKSGYGEFSDKCFDHEKNYCVGSAALYESHWYDVDKDLHAVAKQYPSCVIEVYREGEVREDNVIGRFKGDKQEITEGILTFAPFETILLPGEKTKQQKKKIYCAALIEIDADGQNFVTLHAGKNPEEVVISVISALQTEKNERDLDIEIKEDDIRENILYGNEQSGPLDIPVHDWDNSFILATKVQQV